MRFRCRTKNGTFTLTELQDTSTLAELRAAISKLAEISAENLEIKTGFPPKALEGSESSTLSTLGLLDGEMFTVSEKQGATQIEGNPTKSSSETPFIPPEEVDDAVQVEEGYVIRREMKDDNSCLFRSIGYALERTPEVHRQLRELISDTILTKPEEYSDAILGQSRESYCDWILRDSSWGGAIELSIFSKHYQVEICSIDIKSLRLDRFGEGEYSQRIFVLYSGIHYDVIAMTPQLFSSQEYDQTQFDVADDGVLAGCIELATKFNKKHAYTDLAGFTLRCSVCQAGLKGQKEAQAHAMETGHSEFIEYH
ncbi:ubiquitin thioesterase OTU1-like protein [Basidiobolus meristosporus CBS 931.73]|uniref:Ubiquitin thioesterase OTU n=1 Tax=Basidiobolus meristosporus CBS 931.73 TaxID=1314790 RepID=A0A1Y1Y432_9FUNG|nr:ubiquitin thioesterase OTU1-like protein [Basidiobolus meristosporus CBS 931.73]|eukprot:ORX92344.1 ubiquitin thioesterase OTU1-like protein [Basidiobolus meristosporus CBS 931.73]